MRTIELRPAGLPRFPQPEWEVLGLAQDRLIVASERTEDGHDFIAVHTRPVAGEALNFFLNSNVSYGFTNTRRQLSKGTYEPLRVRGREGLEDYEERFIRRQAHLHHQLGQFSIGSTMAAFEREIAPAWRAALEDPQTDSTYYPLGRTRMFTDLSVAAERHIAEWTEGVDEADSTRRAELLCEALHMVAPEVGFGALKSAHWRARCKAWEKREEDPDGQSRVDGYFKDAVAVYLNSLSPDARDEIVGNAYSRLYYADYPSANHPIHGFVLDMENRRHWLDVPCVYDYEKGKLTDQPEFPRPDVVFENGTAKLLDPNGTSVTLAAKENSDPARLTPWRIVRYNLPGSYDTIGHFPAISWHTDRQGERTFYDQASVVKMVKESGLPIKGTPDSYLGKLLIKKFAQPGEYQPDQAKRKWLDRMGLPGTDETRNIGIRELPVWIQLPWHQEDLVNSQFIQAIELLAA